MSKETNGLANSRFEKQQAENKAQQQDRSELPKMKTINYRGVVEFRIPSSWKEEYSDFDGGCFYENKPDSGTFRLKLITAESHSEITPDSAITALNSVKGGQDQAEALPSGNALARFEESSIERGKKIKIFYWFVSNSIPPKYIRLATFSYTILEKQEHTIEVKQELQMLDHEIRLAKFSKEIGSVVSLH